MKRALSYLRSVLQESPGVDSAVRLQLFIVTVTVSIVFVGFAIGIAAGAIKDVPSGLVTMGTLLFGGSAAAKVTQSFSE